MEPRLPLMKVSTLRSHLRASNQLKDFLKDHQGDAFSHHYAQCYPSNLASLKAAERLYNFMDVSAFNVINIMYSMSMWTHFPRSMKVKVGKDNLIYYRDRHTDEWLKIKHNVINIL